MSRNQAGLSRAFETSKWMEDGECRVWCLHQRRWVVKSKEQPIFHQRILNQVKVEGHCAMEGAASLQPRSVARQVRCAGVCWL